MRSALALAMLVGLAPEMAHATRRLPRSLYTALDPKECVEVERQGDAVTSRCPGIGGMHVVHRRAGDHTYIDFLAEGAGAAAGPGRTLEAPNTVLPPRGQRPTVEWRVMRPDYAPVPYAAIVRYFTSLDGRQGEVLVVAKVATGGSCHVAYVDALANPDAIVLARAIADQRARSFDCASPPTVEGASGASPM